MRKYHQVQILSCLRVIAINGERLINLISIDHAVYLERWRERRGEGREKQENIKLKRMLLHVHILNTLLICKS